jgi:SAM-dependent methyltransferase
MLPLMDRVAFAAQCASALPVRSVLDVGCRDGQLQRLLPAHIQYSGCDLVPGEHVRYVGDVQSIDIKESFDCVIALDLLEHVDDIHGLFDRLAGLAGQALVVSLPNCYDLKSRFKFAIGGRLGGKYEFLAVPVTDRHRWIMGYDEIRRFYSAKAAQHGFELSIHDLQYGDPRSWRLTSLLGLSSRVLGPRLTSECVLGVFVRPGRSRVIQAA